MPAQQEVLGYLIRRNVNSNGRVNWKNILEWRFQYPFLALFSGPGLKEKARVIRGQLEAANRDLGGFRFATN
jgi:hypothetical protein